MSGSGIPKIVYSWKNVSYSVLEKDSKRSKFCWPVMKHKRILKNVSGTATSGQLLAIMGPTGCGKTSLLNVLSARVPNSNSSNSKLTGSVTLNGRERVDKELHRISAYVLQDDKLYPHLTVHETLLLAANFFLPTSVTDEDKEKLVMSSIMELGLAKTVNTIIGDEKVRGISGGERKRANIAVQLISSPLILFMDEPTSGLDSFQAQSVMDSMRTLALNGRLVIAVIHQPRSSIFEMFDQLLLLSEGRTMFLGSSSTAVDYFAKLGFNCPKLFNPSDFFLDVLSPDVRSEDLEQETAGRILKLGDAWEQEVLNGNGEKQVDEDSLVSLSAWTVSAGFEYKRFARNFQLLCWRSFTEQRRDIPTIAVKLCVTSFFSLIIGGIYSNVGYNQKSIQNRIGLLFIICLNQGFNGVIGVLNTFPKEKVIVNRERAANAYDTISYFVAKYTMEMPLNFVPCVLFGCVMYWIVGLNPHSFGYFLLILMMEALTAISLGLAISAVAPNVEAANAMGPPIVIICLLFGGFYINISSLPIVANWVPYISFLKWTFEALCVNEFTNETFDCSKGPVGACETTGEQVLKRLTFTHSADYAVFGLGMVLIGCTTLAYFNLYRSKISYITLGHVGSKIKRFISNEEN